MKTLIDIKKCNLSLKGLVVFDGIFQDERINSFVGLLDIIAAHKIDCEEIYITYHKFYKSMAGENWVKYLVDQLLKLKNEFSVLAARHGHRGLHPFIVNNASRDLKIIQDFAQISPQDLLSLISDRFKREISTEEMEIYQDSLSPENWLKWDWSFSIQTDEAPADLANALSAQWLKNTKSTLLSGFIAQKEWSRNVALLADYFHKVGCDIFNEYGAFKLQEVGDQLQGIKNPDSIRVSNLICQEREQSIVLKNTISFLKGYPANNIILYGNRGTGKSSLVKALLNEYVSMGLRLVQLKKNQIGNFPELVRELSKIPLKFIIFIDDLSFNDVEEDYKNLKSLLEGGVEARPDNVLIYATSNRKHLVKESFSDRKSDDIHANDNMQEKLSLADRFGITVTFLSPDQETYLKIVEELVNQNGIEIDRDELRKKALKWVMMHNGRSGRTARQFIDHLIGELNISEE